MEVSYLPWGRKWDSFSGTSSWNNCSETKILLVLTMNIIKINQIFISREVFNLETWLLDLDQTEAVQFQRHSRRNSLRLMIHIKIYTIHHPNRLSLWFVHHIMRTKCYLVSLIQCLKKEKRNITLFLF